MKNHSLTQGSIAKGLLFFVIPLFFSNLFQQLYNTIDTLLVGHFLGDNALAAMGATAAIFELIVSFPMDVEQDLVLLQQDIMVLKMKMN